MKRIKFLTMLVLLTFVGRAFADNLKVNDITLNAGATQEIAIELINPDKTYTAFQFDLVLPEGITIAKNARNKLIASLNADRIDDQTLNVSEVGNNTYRFISFSMSNAEFYDAEGALVYVTLAAAQDITGGTKVATIASQVITEVSGDQYKWDDLSFNIAVPSVGIPIDATNFPDENFRNYLLSQDYGQDALLTQEEIEGVTEINVSQKGIADLTGIELFTNLTYLWCDNNQLTSLDVSKNVVLERLGCNNNQLTSLDVTNNVSLRDLNCDINQLTALDVSKNVALTWLHCYFNQLTSLDVSKNVALTWLSCSNNQLTSLDVSKNVALTVLECGGNQLTSLDVSKNVALTVLECSVNQLTSLDVSKNVALTELYCLYNQLTSLDVSKNTALQFLECAYNQLTSLDLTNNVALTWLNCHRNQIKDSAMDELISSLPAVESGNLHAMYPPEWGEGNEITPAQVAAANAKGWKVFQYDAEAGDWVEMSGEVAPTGIAIDATNFPDDNFRAWLLSQDYGQDALLTEEEIAGITEIDVSEKGIADLTGIELFTNLTYLNCYDNQLTSLDVTKNVALTALDCRGNKLTSLDVSNNVALTWLDCRGNQLTSLDVSKNVALTSLYCRGNQLTSLDVSNNVALTVLECSYNQLTSLDLTKNVELTGLYCGHNQLTALDVTKNVALTYLDCYYNQLTSLDVSKNGALTELDCYSNQIQETAMDELISSLPTIDSGNLYALFPPESGEGNEITPAQVAAANAKGWKVFQIDAETGEWVEMSGEVAPTGIAIDATNFPDENFRAWLLEQDYGLDGMLTEEEIAGITEIVVNEKGIADLTGLELFTNLTYLNCSSNQLTSLDVTKNVKLEFLNCEANKLTSLDVSYNTALVRLFCGHNQLTSLDVTKNVALTLLFCYNNQLKSLDVTNNVALTVLSIICNQISGTEMDKLVSSLPSIDYGTLFAIDYTQEEGNVVTPKQVSAANARGWKVTRWDAETERYVEMSGEDPDGIQSADKGSLTVDDAVIYNLSGQRLSKPQRGVNIINGKKMVVK